MTAVLGTLLLMLVSVVALTGFLSHAAYQPDLGRNALVDPDLPFTTFFDWPTGPSWLYAFTQGLHVNLGLAAMPVLLAKLWSVIPRLFQWPPVRTPAEGIERVSIALLVASTGFLFATGVANIQHWYVFDFDFVKAHYYAAVVFVAARRCTSSSRCRSRCAPTARAACSRRCAPGWRRRGRSRTGTRSPSIPIRRRSAAAACSSPSAAARSRCSWRTPGSRSAGRCAASRSSPRGARAASR
jgi:hypothetical protein